MFSVQERKKSLMAWLGNEPKIDLQSQDVKKNLMFLTYIWDFIHLPKLCGFIFWVDIDWMTHA